MDPKEIKLELRQALEAFDALQADQKADWAGQAHPDLRKHAFERAKAFDRLKQMLSLYLKNIQTDEPGELEAAEYYRERVAAVLHNNQQMVQQLADYRELIASQLKSMREGRQALNGYGRTVGRDAPRVVCKLG